MRYDAVAGKLFFVLAARKNVVVPLFQCVWREFFSLFASLISLFCEQLLRLRSHSLSRSFFPFHILCDGRTLHCCNANTCLTMRLSVRCNACDHFKRGVAADCWLRRHERWYACANGTEIEMHHIGQRQMTARVPIE